MQWTARTALSSEEMPLKKKKCHFRLQLFWWLGWAKVTSSGLLSGVKSNQQHIFIVDLRSCPVTQILGRLKSGLVPTTRISGTFGDALGNGRGLCVGQGSILIEVSSFKGQDKQLRRIFGLAWCIQRLPASTITLSTWTEKCRKWKTFPGTHSLGPQPRTQNTARENGHYQDKKKLRTTNVHWNLWTVYGQRQLLI